MAVTASTPIELINTVYGRLGERVATGRSQLGRPLTFAEKVLVNHLRDADQAPERGKSYTDLDPDRVAMQDATAQMAMLQFMTAGLSEVAVPATVHCDHLIQARQDGQGDLPRPSRTTRGLRLPRRRCRPKYGIGFWKPGSGIIHQVVLENYAFPGGMMIGTDSHTPNAGGLGMVAIGVGGADAVDVMAGFPLDVRYPKLHRGAPDRRAERLDCPQGHHLEGGRDPHGQGRHRRHRRVLRARRAPRSAARARPPSATWAPRSAPPRRSSPTTTPWPATCKSTGRAAIADAADAVAADLRADDEVRGRPRRSYFDQVVEIDLSTLEPHINGPHTPDLARPVSASWGPRPRPSGWPTRASAPPSSASCTNSSYEDITRAANIARQAAAAGLDLPDRAADHARAREQVAGHHRARRPAGRPRAHRRRGPGQRLRPLHRAVGARRRARGRRNTIVTSLQPQLPRAQRRQRRHLGLRHLARDGGGPGPGRHPRVQPPHRRR